MPMHHYHISSKHSSKSLAPTCNERSLAWKTFAHASWPQVATYPPTDSGGGTSKISENSTDPNTNVQPISARLGYSRIIFKSTTKPETMSHSLVNGLFSNGGNMQPFACAFIMTLKRDYWMSSAKADNSSPQVTLGNSRAPWASWLLVP